MALNKVKNVGNSRRQVPSDESLSGLDDDPIEAGAAEGAQLSERTDVTAPEVTPKRHKRRKPGLNPNQGDLFEGLWPDQNDQ